MRHLKSLIFNFRLFRVWENGVLKSACKAARMLCGRRVHLHPTYWQ
jgi:hypothetical protein